MYIYILIFFANFVQHQNIKNMKTRYPFTRFISFWILFISFIIIPFEGHSQSQADQNIIPKSLNNILLDEKGNMYIPTGNGQPLYVVPSSPKFELSKLRGNPTGTKNGIFFDFQDEEFNGILYFGLINYNDSKHPFPVYRSSPASITGGRALVHFNSLRGAYDMTGWQDSGKGTLGYRVIDSKGAIIYDGITSFTGKGPFKVVNTIVTGPFINLLESEKLTISFETSEKSICEIEVNGQVYKDKEAVIQHEIEISGLKPSQDYPYTVKYGEFEQSYSFKTSPLPGSREKFVFSYSSDSRGGSGWGERNLFGANAYILKKIMAVSAQNNVAFSQFTGDLISGYSTSAEEMKLQYHNWKSVVGPFGHHFQVVMGMGNHESYDIIFSDEANEYTVVLDNFPYENNSSESLFADAVVNPHNGPISEDGSKYDPDASTTDFPSYDETVFYYTYDNVAVINLNSDYWYSPYKEVVPVVGGNIHGYVMDKQLAWFKKTLKALEKDDNIDHVFVTIHTPFFPNGGHVHDDMWYNGNNTFRPWVAGTAVEKGIIERRDQLLDLAINNTDKVVAFLTGDEHNYCKTELGPETVIYPNDYEAKKIKLKRTIYQINNGAAGAPYYAQQETPWTPFTSGFTTQNAVCLFTVEGESISMVVINPDTLEEVDHLKMR